MSAEMGGSMAGAAISAGPSMGAGVAVATGPSIGSVGAPASIDIGRSGIGFDSGAPTFSGLARSDFGSFSIKEGPVGPVSSGDYSNLVADTVSLDKISFPPPETTVRGDIFDQTEVIAKNPSLEPVSPLKGLDIFDNTRPINIQPIVSERGVPGFSLKDTQAIWEMPKAQEPPMIGSISHQPEVDVETHVQNFIEANESQTEISSEQISNAIEDLKTSDPLTYVQLKSDLEIVSSISDTLADIESEFDIEPVTSSSIMNQAVETAVKRSGLVKIVEEMYTSSDPDLETEAETENSSFTSTSVEAQVSTEPEPESKLLPKSTANKTDQVHIQKTGQIPQATNQEESKQVRDEDANTARINIRNNAVEAAFMEDVDPNTGKVRGKDILERVYDTPDQQSDLALNAGVPDGSIPAGDEKIEDEEFNTVDEARNIIYESVTDNTGVKMGKAGKEATWEEARKVLRVGRFNKAGSLPKAA